MDTGTNTQFLSKYGKEYFYNIRYRKKKNKKLRVIHAPSDKLKVLQKEFADWFYKEKEQEFKGASHITGFLPGKSITDNARPHLNKDWIINLDIADFFPSVSGEMGKELFRGLPKSRNPWDLFTKTQGERPIRFKRMSEEDFLETMFLTKDHQSYKLPQGSPASPLIANYIALYKIDEHVIQLLEVWEEIHTTYIKDISFTRYADDMTISFNSDNKDNEDVRKFAEALVRIVCNLLERGVSSGFKIKREKISIKHKSQRQAVTGVVVNGKETRISKKTMSNMRAAIYNIKKENKELDDETKGMLSFIQSVNKEQYTKLMKQLGE